MLWAVQPNEMEGLRFTTTPARFNGYYYATEALEDANEKILEFHEPNWDEILPLFIETDDKFLTGLSTYGEGY